MKLFDLHCDTLSEMYKKGEGLFNNTCHISLDKCSYEHYTQVMAVWSEHQLSEDQNYENCLRILDYAEKHIRNIDGFTPILAVEGGKLLNCDISRLDVLKSRGVKVFTLVWKGVSCIGGAYDNDEGLTPFGYEVVRRLFEYGIVPDLSHSNDLISYQVLKIAKEYNKPVIASHSCSRSVFDHPRNVNDIVAREIALSGGVVGVNFVKEHLGSSDTQTILLHIDRLLNIMGENGVCIGGDLDGMSDDSLPCEIKNVGDVSKLFYAISKKYGSEELAEKILYSNAHNFAQNRLI